MVAKSAAASVPAFLWPTTAILVLDIAQLLAPPNPSLRAWYNSWPVAVGLWSLLGTAVLWPVIMSVRCALRIMGHLLRIRCVRCGYELQGTPGDRCSECGMSLAPPRAPPSPSV